MRTKIAGVLPLCLFLILVSFVLTGCIPGDGVNSTLKPAGFFSGIWHGWIAPFSLVMSFFNPDLGIYEVHNTGLAYDCGFYIAIISGFGGLSLFRNKKTNG